MTTIVMNTLTGAVSEYDWAFQSITPTHAGSSTGLYALGGDVDNGGTGDAADELPIAATIKTGRVLQGDTLKTAHSIAFLAMTGEGEGEFHVHGRNESWPYPVLPSDDGVTRVGIGRGIRENYLAYGYSNVAGADFTLDRIEIPLIKSQSRRS